MRLSRTIGAMAALALLALATIPATAGAPDGSGWYVVSYGARITQADRDALVGAGGTGIRYFPEDSFVAHLEAASVPGAASLRPLSAAEKVSPSLDLAAPARPLTVSVHSAARTTVLRALDRRFPTFGGYPASDGVHDLAVFAPPATAASIAAMPEVLHVGPAPAGLAPLDEMSDQIQAGNYSGNTVAPGYEAWLTGRGLDGSGVTVSVVDTGVDAHPDFGNRIVANVRYGPVAGVSEQTDTYGHGTHVAGIVGGDANGLSALTRVRDAGGHLYGLGVAPKVSLVNQNAIAASNGALCGQGWPPAYPWSRLTTDALDNGASIWNASWWSCEDQAGNYIQTDSTFDALTRDADPDAPGSQPFTFVFSAGNSGAAKTVAAPASAKNVISVGATVNARAGSLSTMASFSSRGPAEDGRILPTISAPGSTIISTRAFAGAAACNVPPTDSFGLYAPCSGTSMAAPHVAGAVALIHQWWKKTNPSAPSPAMTKALLVNSATDMLAPADIPNNNEGWGRVNLGTLFDGAAQRIYVDQTVLLTDLDETRTYRVTPADTTKPMKATVVWTDAPGAAGASPALVNDLDLIVTQEGSGTTYLGNRFSAGFSATGGAPNRKDNVECVFVKTPSGTYTVSVRAANLPGDGVPGAGDNTDQDFALVLTNATLVAG